MTCEDFFPDESLHLTLAYAYGLLHVYVTNPYSQGFMSGISSKLHYHNEKRYLCASERIFLEPVCYTYRDK